MRNILILLIFISDNVFAQLPCPEITSSSLQPESDGYCQGDIISLTLTGNNLYVTCSGQVSWYLSSTPGNDFWEGAEYIGSSPISINPGPCVPPQLLYAMIDPDDSLVGSTDDCEDEFIVLYFGGPNEVWNCYGGNAGGAPDGIFINDIDICFDQLSSSAYCSPGMYYSGPYVPGNASTFNCGTSIDPGTPIPENCIIIIQTSTSNNVPVDLGELCNSGLSIFIIAMQATNCQEGFLDNNVNNCSSCSLVFSPNWCSHCLVFGQQGSGDGTGDGYSGSGPCGSTGFDPPPNTTSGWGFSNALGGGVYSNMVPDVNLPDPYSGTEAEALPFTWMIPNDFCSSHTAGTYYLLGQIETYDIPISCPWISTDMFEIYISCFQVNAGEDQTICEGGSVSIDGSTSGPTSFLEWISSGDGSFGNPSELQTTYLPGPEDINNGLAVLTLSAFDFNGSCGTTIDFCMVNILPALEADAGPDITSCNEENVQLNGSVSGENVNIEWTTSGDGAFGNPDHPATIYSPGQNEINLGFVILTLHVFDPSGLCDPVSSETQLNILQLQVDAGPDQAICFDSTAILNGASSGANTVVWSTSGDGTFGNFTSEQTTYNPGVNDANNGMVILTLTAVESSGVCDPVSSSLQIILNSINYTFNLPSSICENSDPLPLSTSQNGITGNWSGPGVASNTFNPSGQNGIVTLTFTPDAGQCAAAQSQNVLVNPLVIPSITGIPNSLCENSSPIGLLSIQNSINGNWSGQGVTLNTFNPDGLNGDIILTFTPYAGQCALSNTTTIHVNTPLIPIISGVPVSLCENDFAQDLATTQDGINGNWSGPGVLNNTFNPVGQSGMITLTFTPEPGQCALTNEWQIIIETPLIPIISDLPSTICQSDLPISLLTIQNGYAGMWSGPGVINNTFNPNGLSGFITLFFNPDDGQCAAGADVDIIVEPAFIPSLSGIPNILCETEDPFNLSSIQDGIVGNWSGQGVVNNVFNPIGQNGPVTLNFIPEVGQCAEAATIVISVSVATSPVISYVPTSLCQSDSTLFLTPIQDGITGNWSGQNVISNVFVPGGLEGNYVLTFTPLPGQCAIPASTQITVNAPPHFINLFTACDTISQTYQVAFEITGGDPTSYMINGNPATGSAFISSPFIADSTHYVFTLDDGNGCGPVLIEGSVNCACATYAGTINYTGTPLRFCEGQDFFVPFNGDAKLDTDDLSAFVLHDNAGTLLGTIYAISNNTTFSFPSGIVLGHVYFISPVAGSNDGHGSIDLNDPCLSVSQGIPVIFYHPQVTINNGGIICTDDCITYTLQLSGEKPYELAYMLVANGIQSDQLLVTDTNTVNIVICPQDFGITDGVIDIVPLSLIDANCLIDLTSFTSSQTIVRPPSTAIISETLCRGESLTVNGTVYDQFNPSGTQILQNTEGCDSILRIQLAFFDPSIYELSQTLCFGGSLYVNGTEYNESNPNGTEILPGMSMNGCDSIIEVRLEFDSVVISSFNTTLCSGESIEINGNTYDEFHPTGTELFPNGSTLGCDSLVNIILMFYPIASSSLNPAVCKGDIIIINGNVYDEIHPAGIEVIENGSVFGCDSVIRVTLTFIPEAYEFITDTLDAGESIIVNGTIYDQFHSQGIEIIFDGSVDGCDSTIEIVLYFRKALSVLTEAVAPGCHGESTGEIVVKEINGGMPPYEVSIDGGGQMTINVLPHILSVLNSGIHQLIVTDATSTQLLFELEVPETPALEVDAGMDLIILHGEDASLTAKASFPVSIWLWAPDDFLSCDDCPDPLIEKPDHDVNYTINVTDQNGCQASDGVTLTLQYEDGIYAPTVFSPNGDGVNDTWRIYSGDHQAQMISLSIMDRWGGNIFSCSNLLLSDTNVEWDGTYKGKELMPGVFVFVAVVVNGDGKRIELKGDITLLQ